MRAGGIFLRKARFVKHFFGFVSEDVLILSRFVCLASRFWTEQRPVHTAVLDENVFTVFSKQAAPAVFCALTRKRHRPYNPRSYETHLSALQTKKKKDARFQKTHEDPRRAKDSQKTPPPGPLPSDAVTGRSRASGISGRQPKKEKERLLGGCDSPRFRIQGLGGLSHALLARAGKP